MTRFSLSDGPDHARQLIDAYLLDDLDEAGAGLLAAHVRDCPGCAAELGGSTRLLELLRTMPEPAAMVDLDERIIMAALADRALRVARPPLAAGLMRQIFRGAMRTTGTVVLTIVSLALIGGAFVFAASQFISPPPQEAARATLPVVASPTALPIESTQGAVPAGTPTGEPRTQAPTVVPATPTDSPTSTPESVLTPAPTPVPTLVPTLEPTPLATPVVTVATETPGPTASPEPTASPVATAPPATETPRPTPQPTPTATASPSPSPTAAPSDTPTPTPDVSASPKPRRTPPPTPDPGTPSPTPGPTGQPSQSP